MLAHHARYHVKFRRRREGKTDYRQRLRLLLSGKPRAVVRHSLKYVTVQLVNYIPEGDQVVFTHTSKNLKKLGWNFGTNNVPAAYLVGYSAGKEAKKRGIERAVLDIGRFKPVKGCKIFAALKGLVDAGLEIPHGEHIFPEEDRIYGKHIDPKMEKEVKRIISEIDKKV